MARLVVNPHRSAGGAPPPAPDSLAFHRRLPGYEPTPLVELGADVAAAHGVGRLLLKDERRRFDLPAFKMLGASWATYRALCERLGHEPEWTTFDDLRAAMAPLAPLGLGAATDGNHGRAVARMAKLLAMPCHIFVPAGTADARITAIESEGATVTVVDGTYDEAVATSAELPAETWQIISDTSWPGYDTVPRWVVDGYATIMHELDDQLPAHLGAAPPDAVVVPLGVGALGAAVCAHFDRLPGQAPYLLGVEPDSAACVAAALEAGEIVEVPGPHDSIMAGLNCGQASPIAFPVIRDRLDAIVTISDDRCAEAMRTQADEGIDAGECGAAALAAVAEVVPMRTPLDAQSTVVLLATEGVTDPANFEKIVGRPPA